MNSLLQNILDTCSPYTKDGKLANYIPELAKANPNDFGICVISERETFFAGDYKKTFTMQRCKVSLKKEVSYMKMKITYLIFGFVLCLIVTYCSDLIQCEFLTREHYDEFKDAWETNSMIGEMLTFKVLEYETCGVAKVYYITDVSGNVLTFAWDDGAWKEVSWNTIWSKQGNADDVLAPYFWYSAYFRFPNQHGNNS